MATFEKFFIDYMAETMGEAIAMVITEDAITISIDDRQKLSPWHATATFLVDCVFSSKAKADTLLEKVEKAVNALPQTKPLVMSAAMIAQDVSLFGAPRKWRYTGAFQIRWHTEDSY